jgi:hypothetical protein
MEASLVKSPMQYLDQATGTLRDLGITAIRPDFAPINALLEKISDLDRDRIAVISRTLGQTEVFNEVVRDQTQAVNELNAFKEKISPSITSDLAWIALNARVEAASKFAEEAEKKAAQAEADRSRKKTPYESDPLFMYLWQRKFGTSAYLNRISCRQEN